MALKNELSRLNISCLAGVLVFVLLGSTGCGSITGLITKGELQSEISFSPKTLLLGGTPVGVTRSPTLTWPESDDPSVEIDHYEVRVFRASDDLVVTDWTTLSSGDNLSGISLTKNVAYYFKLRAIDTNGVSGGEVRSEAWTTQVPLVTISDTSTDKFGIAKVTGSLDKPSSEDIVLTYSTLEDTAVAGVDFKAVSSAAITIPAGSIEFSLPVTIISNLEGENKAFQARAYESERANLADSTAVVEIKGKEQVVTFVRVASGSETNCALTSTGAVKCWGAGSSGRLGTGSSTDRPGLVDVPALSSGVSDLSLGWMHGCALLVDGTVKCWGQNGFTGTLGDGTTSDRATPVDVQGLSDKAVALTAGRLTSCVILDNGNIACWGSNGAGQYGNGTTTPSLTPVEVNIGTNVTAIAAGSQHVCAVVNGGVRCWGQNSYGQLGNGSTSPSLTPVNVSGLGAGSGVVSVALGNDHSCALLNTGAVRCWGKGGNGQIGNGSTSNRSSPVTLSALGTSVSAIWAGYDHTCATLNDGSLRCWGENGNMQVNGQTTSDRSSPTLVSGVTGTTTWVGLGGSHTCSVRSDGGITCWGARSKGALGNGRVPNTQVFPHDIHDLQADVADVAISGSSACALTKSGAVKCWGQNTYGEVGDGSSSPRSTPYAVPALSSGVTSISGSLDNLRPHFCAVVNGAAMCWGANANGKLGDGTVSDRSAPVSVSGLSSGVTDVVAGSRFSCALLETGAVKCWGANSSGQLGDGSTSMSYVPVQVSGLTSGVKMISAGDRHACAVTEAGGAKCWGENGTSQIGDGFTTDMSTPVDVVGLSSGVNMISAGEISTCALLVSGAVKCWGSNTYGRLGDDGFATQATPVDVVGLSEGIVEIRNKSLGHVCAVLDTGSVKCWGNNTNGQLGTGSLDYSRTAVDVLGLSTGVAKVRSGARSTCVITFDGALKCFGTNTDSLLGVPEPTNLGPVRVQEL